MVGDGQGSGGSGSGAEASALELQSVILSGETITSPIWCSCPGGVCTNAHTCSLLVFSSKRTKVPRGPSEILRIRVLVAHGCSFFARRAFCFFSSSPSLALLRAAFFLHFIHRLIEVCPASLDCLSGGFAALLRGAILGSSFPALTTKSHGCRIFWRHARSCITQF